MFIFSCIDLSLRPFQSLPIISSTRWICMSVCNIQIKQIWRIIRATPKIDLNVVQFARVTSVLFHTIPGNKLRILDPNPWIKWTTEDWGQATAYSRYVCAPKTIYFIFFYGLLAKNVYLLTAGLSVASNPSFISKQQNAFCWKSRLQLNWFILPLPSEVQHDERCNQARENTR